MVNSERLYRLTVDASQAVRELQQLNTSVGRIDKGFSDFGNSLKNFASGAAVTAGLNALVSSFQNTVKSMAEIGDKAQSLQLTTTALQGLSYAATQSGASIQTFESGMNRLAVQIADGGKALTAMGVNTKTASGELKSTDAVLKEIADKFSGYKDNANKAALAADLFGKEAGPKLLQLLNQGSVGITQLEADAKRLGIVMSADAVKAAKDYGDAVDTLNLQMQGMRAELVGPLAAAIANYIQQVNTARAYTAGLAESFALSTRMKFQALMAGSAEEAQNRRIAEYEQKRAEFEKEGAKWSAEAQQIRSRTLQQLRQEIDLYNKLNAPPPVPPVPEIPRVNAPNISAPAGGSKGSGRSAIDEIAKETERFQKELNSVLHEIESLGHHLKTGAGWGEYQAFVEKTTSGLRQLYSPDREAQLLKYVKTMSDMKVALKDYQELQKQEDSIEADRIKKLAAHGKAQQDLVNSLREQAEALVAAHDPQVRYNQELSNLERLKPYLPLELYSKLVRELGEKAHEWFAPIKREMSILESAGNILTDNFNSFFDNLQKGTADAEQAFKRMGQSILAQLARLALNQLFVSLLGSAFGVKLNATGSQIVSSKAALGGVFDQGIKKFASGGVVAAPTFFGMAGGKTGLMGEAGPEAIMPLRRGASGALGVESTPPVVNVSVVNNAGAVVSTEQDDAGNISILIDRVKRSIAGDIRSGGNFLSGAMERTYGVNRAMGAR